MVFGCVSSKGDVMPPHIFPEGLRVNSEVYVDLLRTKVIPWIKQVAGDRPWVWQQDSAPCHTSKMSMTFLNNNCYDLVTPDIWPPNSPDLNPMDYFVWGHIERHTNKSSHNTKDSLITAINHEMTHMDPNMVARACSRFRARVEAVVAAKGDFIE